jgi:hypothetical protein
MVRCIMKEEKKTTITLFTKAEPRLVRLAHPSSTFTEWVAVNPDRAEWCTDLGQIWRPHDPLDAEGSPAFERNNAQAEIFSAGSGCPLQGPELAAGHVYMLG